MKSQLVYCSACDRTVSVLVSEAPADGEIQDARVVCLEIGDHCTGSMCPLGANQPGADQDTVKPS